LTENLDRLAWFLEEDLMATKLSLTIKRRFKAPPEKVFRAWADPERLNRWMGGPEIATARAETDARVGGRYRIVMQKTGDSEQHDVSGVYREVIPNERLVFTWAWKRRRNVSRL
jgi:uncharacterized protein YndB with AHSA1/START domain